MGGSWNQMNQQRPRRGQNSSPVARAFLVFFVVAVTSPITAASAPARSEPKEPAIRAVKDIRVTAVEGESWLRHLGVPFILSSMGRVSNWGELPPNSISQISTGERPDGNFVLSGADLYRLNCRSCHKADGSGVPPEINSIIGPVQATSAAMIRAQMKQRGAELDAKTINQLASQAEKSIQTRLHNGGDKMPPFRHLVPEEVEALRAYLEELAGIPGSEQKQILLIEPASRVGEHLVKGTCHICHEASGSGLAVGVGTAETIPALASFPVDRFPYEVIRKVREGVARPKPMMTSSHGQMPVFGSLTPGEIGAAYAYLVRYPPKP